MKLKAVLHKGANVGLVAALESREFREKVLDEVLCKHLHTGDLGPAEFYIQECDYAVGSTPMCEVRLTGVSGVTMRRAPADFLDARNALENVYRSVIERHIQEVGNIQLMVSIMLDQKPELLSSALIERDGDPAIWLRGPAVMRRADGK